MVQVKLIESNSIMNIEKDINDKLKELSFAGVADEELSVQYNICPINSIVSATAMIIMRNM